VGAAADSTAERLRTCLRWCLRAGLVLSPLPFGGVEPWAVVSLEVWAGCLGALALAILVREPVGLTRAVRALIVPAAGLVCIGVVQLVPLPRPWVTAIGLQAADMRPAVGEFVPGVAAHLTPSSIEAPLTLDATLRLATYLLIAVAAAVAVRTSSHLRQVALAVALSGAFQALYGSVEYLSGHNHIFGYAKTYFLDSATGTFINRNHFAGYLAMALPLALALAFEKGSTTHGGWRRRFVALSEPWGLRKLVGAGAAFLIWTGVVLSYSRGGMIVAVAAVGLAVFALVPSKRRLQTFGLILILPVGWFLWQEVRAPAERFAAPREEVVSIGGRLPTWRVTSTLVASAPLLGSGLGTFRPAFEAHRTADVKAGWDHAHNDWLESAAEAGVPGTLLLLILLFRLATRRLEPPEGGREPAAIAWCITASIAGIALYSALDFCLRIPANAVLLAALVGLAVRAVPARAGPPRLAR
jgi:O-antigen ligase